MVSKNAIKLNSGLQIMDFCFGVKYYAIMDKTMLLRTYDTGHIYVFVGDQAVFNQFVDYQVSQKTKLG